MSFVSRPGYISRLFYFYIEYVVLKHPVYLIVKPYLFLFFGNLNNYIGKP